MSLFRKHAEDSSEPRIQRLADHGLLCTFGETIHPELSRAIARVTASLATADLPGVIDLVPSYTTLLIIVAPGADPDPIARAVSEHWKQAEGSRGEDVGREVTIPVRYGGDDGPDLDDVARHTGLDPQDVIARHAGGNYEVGAIGFAPGFAFLTGLDPALATPRRSSPRTQVPGGSVAIGGGQTGMYSLPTPGGWNLIGRTRLTLFDPDRDPPSLLAVGDRVRFERVERTTRDTPVGLPGLSRPSAMHGAGTSPAVLPSQFRYGDAFEVVEPGLQTSVQDLGRPGHGRIGVSPGGAADKTSLIAGNRLLGNPDGAAALEITLAGPRLRVLKPIRLAITGADLGATIAGLAMPVGAARVTGPGDEIAFTRPAKHGARAYLCVAGGIDVPAQLGSRSTDLVAGFGGLEGRALRRGDRLRTGTPAPRPSHPGTGNRNQRSATRLGRDTRPHIPTGSRRVVTLRVTPGPQRERFDEATWKRFLTAPFTVSPLSNRMGVRLDGPALVPDGGADIISEGVVTGAIQVTGDGQPIILGVARATIGGYPKIGTVIAADLDLIGQVQAGDTIRFANVDQ